MSDEMQRTRDSIARTYAAMQLLVGEPDVETPRPNHLRNPEDDVLDAIDELVSETMAAGVDRFGNPLDNYTSNRYPGCPNCPHDWHGVKCAPRGIDCPCLSSDGEAEPVLILQAPPEVYLDPQDWVDVQGDLPELPIELQFPRPYR